MKRFLITGLLVTGSLCAQVPDTPSPAAPAAKPSPAAPQQSAPLLGNYLPVFNPGTEIFTWDGKNWNIANQRVFQARFEKYLNAPEDTTAEDERYRAVIAEITKLLAPDNYTSANLVAAWRMLSQASNFTLDAHLCDALADAVYSAWQSKNEHQRLQAANFELEKLRKQHEWNAQMTAKNSTLASPSKDPVVVKQEEEAAKLRLQPYVQRLAEVNARILANNTKRQVSELQVRIEFQVLLMQLFLQRRYQHVLMGTQFYRRVFSDGDTTLKVGEDTKLLFAKTGMPPTVGTLDALAHEAMRDVHEGVAAFNYLFDQSELESATKRLTESLVVGEYLPAVRTVPRERKRQVLLFTQKTNRLISALDVKDYTLAETLVKELTELAKDFDTSQPLAVIETSKAISAMHIAKAKNAAVAGDRATLEDELKAATVLWPRNPALIEVSTLIFAQGDVQQKAVTDLDQLLSQRNYRQIYDDKIRFIAATALYPDRQEKLKKVLDDMALIESTIIRCNEIAKHGDTAGAWESAEIVFRQFPDDNKLNQLRANLTTQAADFVRSLNTAEDLERQTQTGASLAWFLKAQKLYPPSQFALEGIARLVAQIVPPAGE